MQSCFIFCTIARFSRKDLEYNKINKVSTIPVKCQLVQGTTVNHIKKKAINCQPKSGKDIPFNSIHTSERFAYLRIKFECKDKKKELNHQHISEYFAYTKGTVLFV